jgi:phosphorylcholine metabolism protein LicD
LGAIRHRLDEKSSGGIIPWDDDTDVVVRKQDRGQIEMAFKKLFEMGYYLTRCDEQWGNSFFKGWKIEGHKTSFFINGKERMPFCDFFEIEQVGDKYIFPKTGENDAMIPKFFFQRTDLFPIIKKPFGNGFVNVPNNFERILTESYGKNWNNSFKRWSHYFDINDKKILPLQPDNKQPVPQTIQ